MLTWASTYDVGMVVLDSRGAAGVLVLRLETSPTSTTNFKFPALAARRISATTSCALAGGETTPISWPCPRRKVSHGLNADRNSGGQRTSVSGAAAAN